MKKTHQQAFAKNRFVGRILIAAVFCVSAVIAACSGPEGPTLGPVTLHQNWNISSSITDSGDAGITTPTRCALTGLVILNHDGNELFGNFSNAQRVCTGANPSSITFFASGDGSVILSPDANGTLFESITFRTISLLSGNTFSSFQCEFDGGVSSDKSKIDGFVRCFFAPGGTARHFSGPFELTVAPSA